MNPYEVLGLDPLGIITREDIEAAHRAKRSAAHPDHNGGNTEKMTELNTSRDILLNPERKRRYDQVGSTESGTPSIEELATNIIGSLFQSAVEQLEDDQYSRSKVLTAVVGEISKGAAKAREAAEKWPSRIKRLDKLIKSIDCDPLLKKILEQRLLKLQRDTLEVNQQVELGNMMLKLMKSIKFK